MVVCICSTNKSYKEGQRLSIACLIYFKPQKHFYSTFGPNPFNVIYWIINHWDIFKAPFMKFMQIKFGSALCSLTNEHLCTLQRGINSLLSFQLTGSWWYTQKGKQSIFQPHVCKQMRCDMTQHNYLSIRNLFFFNSITNLTLKCLLRRSKGTWL